MALKTALKAGIMSGLVLFSIVPASAQKIISRSDKTYLRGVYQDTWRYLDHFVNAKTGLPYDSQERRPSTSITNIGFYMASAAVAGKTGLLSPQDALARLKKAMVSLAAIEKWRGFPVTWVDAETLQTTEKQFSTVDHLGNLTASLILVKNLYPELAEAVDSFLAPMDWGIIYEPGNQYYRGGYDTAKQDFDVKQEHGDWYYNFLGADTRLGSFFGVASGQVPVDHWKALNREVERRFGESYLVPGWQGGGLFMQCISGLFLDERYTLLGKSAATFAYVQILHAARIGAPAWGWSACVSPSGEYLGWGAIQDEIVTPHASALVVSYYPRRVVQNLKFLEGRGVRAKFNENGKRFSFGFRDSFNWTTGQVASGYLTLDQSMLFLALANFLHNGLIWKAVQAEPVVQVGYQNLPEYTEKDAEAAKIYDRRDRATLSTPSADFP